MRIPARASLATAAASVSVACGAPPPAIPPLQTAPAASVTTVDDGFNSAQYHFNIVKDERRYSLRAPGSVQAGAAAIHRAFTALGIHASTLTAAPRVIGNERLMMRRAMNGSPLSGYFDCGTNMSGVLANVYRLRGAFLVSATPIGSDSVLVEARLTAQAFSNEGASGGGIDCTTLGGLEQRLLNEVRASLQKATAAGSDKHHPGEERTERREDLPLRSVLSTDVSLGVPGSPLLAARIRILH